MRYTFGSICLLAVAVAAAGCGDAAGHGAHAPADAAADVSADVAPGAILLNDCTPAEYVDRSGDTAERTVVPRGTTGYTPRCFIIRAGQSVTFSMDFTTHPLTAGVPHGSSVGATTPSPIAARTTGTTYTATFAAVGHYPFYCTVHGHVGMAGVVRVIQ